MQYVVEHWKKLGLKPLGDKGYVQSYPLQRTWLDASTSLTVGTRKFERDIAVLAEGVCAACRGLKKVSKDEPRLAWILGEHAGLDRWNHWQLAETATVYIVQASGLLKRLLAVVEKETLAVQRLATAPRLTSTWVDVPETERAELLK